MSISGQFIFENLTTAVVFEWDFDMVAMFANHANQLDQSVIPTWVTTKPPHITAKSLADEMMQAFIAECGGEQRCGCSMIAPLSLDRYGRLIAMVVRLETESFVQNCVSQLPPGRFLAKLTSQSSRTFLTSKKLCGT